MKRALSAFLFVLLLVNTLTFAFNTQNVKASGTIYIRADGSVDPPTAPIQRNGDIYTLTDSIGSSNGGIGIQRDSILVNGAGYGVQGIGLTGTSGIDLQSRTNVTIRNLAIRDFYWGINLAYSSDNTITENSITNNGLYGICIESSGNNIVSGNSITHNQGQGIYTYRSSNNRFFGNTIANNGYCGISLNTASQYNIISGNEISNGWYGIYLADSSSSNIISENNIASYDIYGIELMYYCANNIISGNNITSSGWARIDTSSSDNIIYHNNFIYKNHQVYCRDSTNVWDDGYPSGGNYWSDYAGVDSYSGTYQNETGSDGMGDTPYVIDSNNQDNYPLMNPWTLGVHDVAVADLHHMKTGCAPAEVVCLTMTMEVYATVENQGDFQETFNVSLYANATQIGEKTVTLDAGSGTILTFTWDSTLFAEYARYDFSAVAELTSDSDLTDNTFNDGRVRVVHMGDITADGKVDISDVARVSGAFGSLRVSNSGDPQYGKYRHPVQCVTCPHEPNTDLTGDSKVDIEDLSRTSANFGWHQP